MVDGDSVTDLPVLWASARWRAETHAWIGQRVADFGHEVTGVITQPRTRFWSTQLQVPTTAGSLWFKENAPSQAFEAALVEELSRIAPSVVPPVVGVDRFRGWLLTADMGTVLSTAIAADDAGREDGPAGIAAMVELVGTYADLQRRVATAHPRILESGVPVFDDLDAPAYAEALADELAALPRDDARRIEVHQRRTVERGLWRLREAASQLAASGIGPSLDHNDLHLGNALRGPGGSLALIDFADAVWAHPVASVRIPLWLARVQWGCPPGSPPHDLVLDAFLEPWTDCAPLAELRSLVAAAERVSCLHRAESWRRLMADVPQRCVDERFTDALSTWLLAAVAEDPYAEATGR